jgi:fructose-bisphosphate aldolase/2-amino-3,7-dideoxy-D-threo-hept-6-ulosonate synthase
MEFLQMIDGALQAGARGVAIGRNVFQHQDPVKMTMAIAAIVNKGKTAEEAIKILS